METQVTGNTAPAGPEHGPNVNVTVDGVTKSVHRGSHLVAELKQLLGVDASKDLDELVNGELKPLQDTDRITIKGGEVFISHARTGGSS
jgi:hypothetical protein